MKSRTKVLLISSGLLITSAVFAQTISFETVLDIAAKFGVFNASIHPLLEREEPNEAESIKNIALDMYKIQMATQPQSRDAHAKGHGCAEAQFTVEKEIPVDLQVGLFANAGKSFDTIIRYSNGAGKAQTDSIPDGRGMAIKVMGGAPNGNLLGSGTTQDFMLINNPEFFIRSIKDYADFQNILIRDGKADAFILGRLVREALDQAGVPNPELVPDADIEKIEASIVNLKSNPLGLEKTLWSLYPFRIVQVNATIIEKLALLAAKKAPLELKIIQKLSREIGSSVTESYFSMASYLLAAKNGETAVKYSARPVDCTSGAAISPKAVPENVSNDFLREDLAKTLSAAPVCYELFVQVLPAGGPEQRKTLVEDSRLDYGTKEIAVARLVLPVQSVDTPAKQQYCENLSYNPWQAGAEHQPLGGMNRARKVAVTASSIRRHLLTGSQREEPTSLEAFRNLK